LNRNHGDAVTVGIACLEPSLSGFGYYDSAFGLGQTAGHSIKGVAVYGHIFAG
tara:strand:- start:1624 stop:1782 length:159 start_codon:yes stop_codon:yes gene_type:complete